MSLRIENLTVTFDRFTLGPIALDLARGDYFVLMGPSGCGKTTLLRAIAGVNPGHQGDIYIDGVRATAAPPQKRRVGYVSQTASLFPHLSVSQNISFGLSYTDLTAAERKNRFDEIVAMVGAEPLLQKRTRTLSGGEAKRVALARSLAVRPRILLLDEPLAMLDSPSRSSLLGILKRIHEETGTITIHVTHQLDEASTINSLCGIMRDGRLIRIGTAEEVLRDDN